MVRTASIVLVFVTMCFGSLVSSQEIETLHEFTSKTGKKVIAEVLQVSVDSRTMKIRRQDGNEYDLEIVSLSLDDQQYVKTWMQDRPVTVDSLPTLSSTDFRLELEIDKKSLDTERHKDRIYTYEQRYFQYDVVIRNISRETLVGARMEYAVLWENALEVYKNSLGEWDGRYSSSGPAKRARIVGEKEIEDLSFNRDVELATESFEQNRMLSSGELFKEDELLGIVVRIVAPDGSVIVEERSGSPAIQDIPWKLASFVEDPEDD
ncbi:MAG: hypothetical protein P1U85_00065 [Verrucomicrobiales bacterium]|jgi:hypothetical protein|nr:hypothetical protein [Verrucomicrobiales bacterium]